MGDKDIGVAYCLWFFFGFFGVHRFYLDRPISGLIYLFTFGIFGIGWLVDICLIPSMVDHYNTHHHHQHHHSEQTIVVTTPYQQPVYATPGVQPVYVATQPVGAVYAQNPYPPPQQYV